MGVCQSAPPGQATATQQSKEAVHGVGKGGAALKVQASQPSKARITALASPSATAIVSPAAPKRPLAGPASAKQHEGAASKGAGGAGGGAAPGDDGHHAHTVTILQAITDVYSDYDFDKVLGKGNFGVVRLVRHKVSGEELACKSISKRKLVSPQDVEEVRREVQIMNHLAGHPNVTNLRCTYEDRDEVHLLMDLCTGGELFDKISAEKRFSEKAAATIVRSIVRVVHHCHTMNVIHRDLKPENFLLSDSSAKAHLKATDFGLSRFFKDGEYLSEIVGSPYYVAPEVLQRKYLKHADIWSCGVILYILLCGTPPFKGDSSQAIFRSVLTAPLDLHSEPWGHISDGAKDIVRRMLTRDPKRRVTAEQVLAHPWLKEDGSAGDEAIEPEVLLRMRTFSRMNKLKKAAYQVIAASLPTSEISGMKQMFEDIDKDASGNITVDELRMGLRLKGADLAVAEVQRILDDIDINGNSIIDYEEFLAATMHTNKLSREENMVAAFKHFDITGTGFITRDALMQALQALGETQQTVVDAVLSEVDSNGDGKIDYEEFCAMMRRSDLQALTGASTALRSHIFSEPKLTDSFRSDLHRDFGVGGAGGGTNNGVGPADASLPGSPTPMELRRRTQGGAGGTAEDPERGDAVSPPRGASPPWGRSAALPAAPDGASGRGTASPILFP